MTIREFRFNCLENILNAIDNERFEMWLKNNRYVADGNIDIETLREVFKAMDDEDK